MKTDFNGCSTCPPGEERFEDFETKVGSKTYKNVQYDYRTDDGKLFSCVARSIEEARKKRDLWDKIIDIAIELSKLNFSAPHEFEKQAREITKAIIEDWTDELKDINCEPGENRLYYLIKNSLIVAYNKGKKENGV